MEQGEQYNKSGYKFAQDEKKAVQTDEKQINGHAAKFHFNFANDSHYDEFMRKPRSQTYIEAMQLVDMLSSTDEAVIERLKELVDEETVEEFRQMTPEEILEELRLSFEEEFEAAKLELKEAPIPPVPTLVVCECYIDGCDIHAIDGHGNILEHYGVNQKVDDNVRRGREVYHQNKGCMCVEVYPDCCRVIMEDGSVEKVNV